MENCKKRGGKKERGEITHALSHSPPLLDRSCKQVSSIKMAKQKTSPFLPVSPLALSLSPCVSIPHASAGARRRRRRRRGIKVSSPPFRAVKLAGPKERREGGGGLLLPFVNRGEEGDGHPRRKTVFGRKRDEISEFTFPKCREKETFFFRFCRGNRNNIFPEERERGQ